jgi:hypothetical protein
MLAAERQTLVDLDRAISIALAWLHRAAERATTAEEARRALLGAIHGAADELKRAVAASVLQGRARARREAVQQLAAELDAVALELRIQPIQAPPASFSSAEDDHYAAAAADSFTAAWRASVLLVAMRLRGDDGGPVAPKLRQASDAQRPKLARIAATEIPRAYNAAHDEGAGWVAERYGGARWLPLVAKRWDATLDRKVCKTCASMDGRLALLGTSFTGDIRPGEPHPHCRCVESIIVLPMAMRGEFTPGHQVDDDHPRDAAA